MWHTSKFLQVLAGLLDVLDVVKLQQAELQARDVSFIGREGQMAFLVKSLEQMQGFIFLGWTQMTLGINLCKKTH